VGWGFLSSFKGGGTVPLDFFEFFGLRGRFCGWVKRNYFLLKVVHEADFWGQLYNF